MKANNKVETDGEDQKKKMLSLEDDVCVEYLVEGEALVVKRTLNMHVKVNDSEG